jgi:hypothetical protein
MQLATDPDKAALASCCARGPREPAPSSTRSSRWEMRPSLGMDASSCVELSWNNRLRG